MKSYDSGVDPSGAMFGACSPEMLGLVDADAPEAFDAITRLALRLFGVSVALISIVQEEKDRQFFSSQQGLGEPWASLRQTPVSHSFCQRIVETGRPLKVSDAHTDRRFHDHPAVSDLNVVSYLGVPVLMPDNAVIGALCVIGDQPRAWTDDDLAALQDLAHCVNDEIRLRALLVGDRIALERTNRYNALRESITVAFMAPDMPIDARFNELLRVSCEALGFDTGLIARVDGDAAEQLFLYDASPVGGISRRLDFAGSLSAQVIAGQEQIQFHAADRSAFAGRRTLDGKLPGAYVGTPLILDGRMYGTLEYSSSQPRAKPWANEELTMLGIISMFVCAHLGIFGQIRTLQHSEASLLSSLLDARHGTLGEQRN